jgi:tetratricopeptide (TPR) repeat protein
LKEAGERFKEAAQLDTNNLIAQINLQFNARLQGRQGVVLNTADMLDKAYSQYRGWESVLRLFGPVDEPDADLVIGRKLAQGGNLRQAGAMFERCLELRPNNEEAELDLAKTYNDINQPDRALEFTKKLHHQSGANRDEVLRVEAIAYVKKNQPQQAETILLQARQRDPSDVNGVGILAEFYRLMASAALQQGDTNAARGRFQQALGALEEEIKLLNSPAQSAPSPEDYPNALLRKAEVENDLGDHKQVVAVLTQYLQLRPDDPVALLYRANSRLEIGQLAEAKRDYQALLKMVPDAFDAMLGLGKVAEREKNSAEAIGYYKRFLGVVPTNSLVSKEVERRIKALQGQK